MKNAVNELLESAVHAIQAEEHRRLAPADMALVGLDLHEIPEVAAKVGRRSRDNKRCGFGHLHREVLLIMVSGIILEVRSDDDDRKIKILTFRDTSDRNIMR